MAGAAPKEEYPWYYAPTAFCVFAIGNIGLNYFNSWVQHPSEDGYPGHGKAGFQYPFFYTMWHMLASALAALVMQLTCQKPKTGSPYPTLQQLWDYKYQLIPISTLTVLNNGCNNLSLGLVALFINQVIKACGPAPTALFEFIFMGKTCAAPARACPARTHARRCFWPAHLSRNHISSYPPTPSDARCAAPRDPPPPPLIRYNLAIYGSVGLIVCGSILANYSSMSNGGSTQLMGVVWVCVSLFAASLRPVLQRLLVSSDKARGSTHDRPPLTVPQALFWDCGIAFFGMMAVWLLSNEREPSVDYLTSHTPNPQSGLLAVACIVFSSFLAFIFNFATYYFILFTSALTSTIGSNGVKIFLILVTMITDNMIDLPSVCGVVLVVLSICLYTYFQHQFKQSEAARAADSKAAPLASKADEKTPLASKV